VRFEGTEVDVVEVLTGLEGFRVRTARQSGRLVELEVELAAAEAPCPACGTFSGSVKEYPSRPVKIVDAPSFDRPVVVWWWKRRFRCQTPGCAKRSFVERCEQIAPRARTSERLRDLACRWVKTRPISEIAAEVGVSWRTVWRWSKHRIEARLGGRRPPERLGLDETSFRRRRRFVTSVVDLDSGRLYDLVEGRSGTVVADWLDTLTGDDRSLIDQVAMDPYSGYLRAVRDHTDAEVVLDRFHVIRLANQALTDIRCRRQIEMSGHRGRRGDPLYGARHDLLRGRERLTERQQARLRRAFDTDRWDELECGWVAKETLRDIYQAADREEAARLLAEWYRLVAAYQIPELDRLAGTLRRWQPQFLAYFEHRITNGPTEGRNLIIKHVKRTGFGFRNFDNYRLRVLHRCS